MTEKGSGKWGGELIPSCLYKGRTLKQNWNQLIGPNLELGSYSASSSKKTKDIMGSIMEFQTRGAYSAGSLIDLIRSQASLKVRPWPGWAFQTMRSSESRSKETLWRACLNIPAAPKGMSGGMIHWAPSQREWSFWLRRKEKEGKR